LKVEQVHIDIVALPGKRSSADGKFESNKIVNGAHGRVLTGNPLRICKRDGAGRVGDGHGYMENAARYLPGIDGELDWASDCPLTQVRK
jgi:hypothetical protein